MKRILSVALCIILAFSLCACSKPAEKTEDPIIGRWLYRAHTFIQVLTITEDNIERVYMLYEPENLAYSVNEVTTDGDTRIYNLAVTEGELTYDTQMTLNGDTLVWETFEYHRLAEGEEVDYNFSEDEINDMLFTDNEIVEVNPETNSPAEDDTPPEDATKEETPEETVPEVPQTSDNNPLIGLWRHTNDKFVLDFEFTKDGKKYEFYDDESDGYTTYKITSVTENEDGSATIQIEENDEGMILPINIVINGNSLNYGEDEFIFTKVK